MNDKGLSDPQPSEEARSAREAAEQAKKEAQENFRNQAAEKLAEAVRALSRIADHSRADTFVAMVQHELTKRSKNEL